MTEDWNEKDYKICSEYDEKVKQGKMGFKPVWTARHTEIVKRFEENRKSGKSYPKTFNSAKEFFKAMREATKNKSQLSST